MKKSDLLAPVSRRAFGSVALGTALGAAATAQQKPKRLITSASVPEDPDAPGVQIGTVAEQEPFAGSLDFARQPVALKVRPFDMAEVRLLPGPFLEILEANRAMLHRLPADRLVHTFRLNAAIPSSAQPLGGWEKPGGELRGHFPGHFLSACALMYASTGDADVKAKGDEMVSALSDCQKKLEGGYLSAFPTEFFDRLNARKKVWAPFYTVHKIMAGMLDMHRYTGNQQALTVVTGMAEWADRWTASMPEQHMQMVLDTEYGGMNDVLYELAAVTGQDRFAVVGDRFTKKRFFNPLALRRDELIGLHTNTHIPQVIGAARRYELSGDVRFHDVADTFWHNVVETRTYVTGGTSNNEGWLVGPNQLATELRQGVDTNECCCAYNMMKLTRMLYSWSGDPRHFDYYERALYNHRLGTIDKETGVTQYYLGLVPGSWRTFGTTYDTFWCCNGTGVEEYSKLNDSIYFHDADGIYVNLFIPSELHWKENGFRVRQETRFPEEAASTLHIDLDRPAKLAVRVRIPSWVNGNPTVKINGKDAGVTAVPGSYVSVVRTWKKGDRVEIRLPMRLRVEAMPDDRRTQAVLYGPIVLAGELDSAGMKADLVNGPMGPQLKKVPAETIPRFRASGEDVSAWIRPADRPLTFRTTGQQTDITLKPFYSVGARRYSIYWNVS